MTSVCDRPLLRLALIGVLGLSLALAACGRKGPLDPPPGASAVAPVVVMDPNEGLPPTGPDGKPLAPAGVNKRIPLDVLLN